MHAIDHSSKIDTAKTWLASLNHVELEIGYGDRGETLRHLARTRRDTLFIGVDVRREFSRVAQQLANSEGLNNVLFLTAEGQQFLDQCVPTERLEAIHLYFPSPYRAPLAPERLVTESFVSLVYNKLSIGGYFRVATDEQFYFRTIDNLLSTQLWSRTSWRPSVTQDDKKRQYLVGTPWERRIASSDPDKTIHAMDAQKYYY